MQYRCNYAEVVRSKPQHFSFIYDYYNFIKSYTTDGEEIRTSNVGYMYSSEYMGVYCYADDLSLLSPSLTGLQDMLRLCDLYAIHHNIIFNDKKMLIVRIVQVNFSYLGEKLF